MRWQEMIRNQLGNKCADCGKTENLRIHHKLPRRFGGTDMIANLTLLCSRCHGKAHRLINHVLPKLSPEERERLELVMKIMGTENMVEAIKELNKFAERFEKWDKKYYGNIPVGEVSYIINSCSFKLWKHANKPLKEDIVDKITGFLMMVNEYYPSWKKEVVELYGAQTVKYMNKHYKRPREKKPEA